MALTLLVRFLADASQLTDATTKAGGGVKVLGKELDLGVIAKGAAVAGAVGLAVSAITDMTLAAAADRDAQNALATAMEASGANIEGWEGKVDAAIAAGQALAFTDDDIRESMATLTAATGDVDKATTDLAIAQDIARSAGVDLATASDAVAKAEAGQDGALRKLLPGLEKGATAQDTIAAASKRAAGAADTYAKSTKGMGETGSIAFSELTETIGSIFLPILDAIIPALLPILQAFGQLVKAILPLLVPLIKALGTYLGIVAKIFVAVVNVVVKAVTWFAKLVTQVGNLLAKLGPLRDAANFVGGIIGGLSSPAAAGSPGAAGAFGLAAPRAGGAGSAGWSPVTIHAYGDPDVIESAVVRALRRYDRTNGAAQLIPRWS